MKIEKTEPCPTAASNAIRLFNFTTAHATRGVFLINADIIVERNITGPLLVKYIFCKCYAYSNKKACSKRSAVSDENFKVHTGHDKL